MLTGNINSVRTSSAGRLFDAVASILGLYQSISYEGQAALMLESILEGTQTNECYPFEILEPGSRESLPAVIDWSPMILRIFADITRKVSHGRISAKFHNTLAEMIVAAAQRAVVSRTSILRNPQSKNLKAKDFSHTGTARFRPMTEVLRWAKLWLPRRIFRRKQNVSSDSRTTD